MRGRKDLAMKKQRTFSVEFKRQIIEELLSSAGDATCRRVCFTIRRSSIPGANSTMSFLKIRRVKERQSLSYI